MTAEGMAEEIEDFDLDLELTLLIHSAISICDEDNDAHLMARYLLQQAVMVLEASPTSEADGFTH